MTHIFIFLVPVGVLPMETWKLVIVHIFLIFVIHVVDFCYEHGAKLMNPLLVGVNYKAGQEEDAGVYALSYNFPVCHLLVPTKNLVQLPASDGATQAGQSESKFVTHEKAVKSMQTAAAAQRKPMLRYKMGSHSRASPRCLARFGNPPCSGRSSS